MTFAKISKITHNRKFIKKNIQIKIKNIKIKITNISKPIVIKIQSNKNINFIKHINNVKFQQL